jgi:predicted RNase H-like HicB family nuclease
MPGIRLSVLIVEDDGVFSAFCQELEGCMTQGNTLEEVKRNIVEAIHLNLEHLAATGKSLPTRPLEKSDGDLFLPAIPADDPLAQKFAALDKKMVGNRQQFDLVLA